MQQVALSQTQLVILGAVHEPTRKFTADSIANILSQLNPDLILLELDSSFFTSDFVLKKESGNERTGTIKYISKFPTPLRPFEIEGRNQYYRQTNYFENENKSYKSLRSIKRKLSSEQKEILLAFSTLNKELRKIGKWSPSKINQKTVYNLVEQRQEIKFKQLNKIFIEKEELKEHRDFYNEMGVFWDKRNKAMAQNIIKYLKLNEYHNKTVIVLTGFYHKYYLLNELIPLQKKLDFAIREFYEL